MRGHYLMAIETGVRNNGLLFRSEAVVVEAAFIRAFRALSDVTLILILGKQETSSGF